MAWLFKGLAWLLLGVLALGVIWWSWKAGFELFWPFVGLLVAGISLHRSVKAFVEFWRGRISERVEIEVAVANLLLFWTLSEEASSTEESIMGKSRRSRRRRAPNNTGSLAGPLSARSLLSILSFGSVLSIGSAGSILSIGSAGSILSIGSAGSILSIGSAGSILSIGGAGSSPRTDREEPEEGRSEQT